MAEATEHNPKLDADPGSNTVTPVNTQYGAVGTPVPVGSEPSAVAVTPDGSEALVANAGSATLTPGQ